MFTTKERLEVLEELDRTKEGLATWSGVLDEHPGLSQSGHYRTQQALEEILRLLTYIVDVGLDTEERNVLT